MFAPQRVLAVTFTARAAGEMRSRLRDLGVSGVQARTFHAAALRQLHYFWPQAIGGAAPEVLPHKAGLVAEAASRLRLPVDRAAVRDLAAEVEWAKVSLLTPETYAAAARTAGRDPAGLDATTVARLLEGYEQAKVERGVIDFEDVLLVTAGVLQDNPQIAATVREQYRHFVVDEYQDVNPLQQRLLDLWLGGREELCVVGDAAQTIYSFTGASPQHLLGFARRYPQARVVKLVRDYRSTPQVVHLANGVLARAGGLARSARLELVAQRPPGPEPQFTSYADDVAEAGGGRDRRGQAGRRRHPGQRDRRALPHQRAVRAAGAGARRGRRALRAARRGAVLRPPRGARRDRPAARRGPVRRRGRAAGRGDSRRPVLRRLVGRAAGRHRRGPRALGVAAGAGRPGRRAGRGPAGARRWATW